VHNVSEKLTESEANLCLSHWKSREISFGLEIGRFVCLLRTGNLYLCQWTAWSSTENAK